jgi:hypothetical protein
VQGTTEQNTDTVITNIAGDITVTSDISYRMQKERMSEAYSPRRARNIPGHFRSFVYDFIVITKY